MKVLHNGKAVENVDPPAVETERVAKAIHDVVAELAGSQWDDPDVRANYERYARAAIEAMREPTPDPHDTTITRLSAELEAARECLERLASLVPFPTPDELGFIHPQVTARAEFARVVLAKLSKGE